MAATIRLNLVVDDKGSIKGVTSELNTLNKAQDRVNRGTNETKRNLEGVASRANRAGKDFSRMSQGMGGLVQAYATVAANVFALSSAFEFLKRNANLSSMIKSSEDLGKATGLAMQSIVKVVKEASGAQLDYAQSLQVTNKLAAVGADVGQTRELVSLAAKAAQTFGGTTTDAINRFVGAIQKGETELLKQVGLMINLTQAYEIYAAELGKTKEALTANEKQQAILNATLQEGNRQLGDITLDPNPYERLAVAFSDLTDEVTQFIRRGLDPLVIAIAENKLAIFAIAGIIVGSIGRRALPILNEFAEKSAAAARASADIALAEAAKSKERFKFLQADLGRAKTFRDKAALLEIQRFQKVIAAEAGARSDFRKDLLNKENQLNQQILAGRINAIRREQAARARGSGLQTAFAGVTDAELERQLQAHRRLASETSTLVSAANRQMAMSSRATFATMGAGFQAFVINVRTGFATIRAEALSTFATVQTAGAVGGFSGLIAAFGKVINQAGELGLALKSIGERAGFGLVLGEAAKTAAGGFALLGVAVRSALSIVFTFITVAALLAPLWEKVRDKLFPVSEAQKLFTEQLEESKNAIEAVNEVSENLSTLLSVVEPQTEAATLALFKFSQGLTNTMKEADKQIKETLGTAFEGFLPSSEISTLEQRIKNLEQEARRSLRISNIANLDQFKETNAEIEVLRQRLESAREAQNRFSDPTLLNQYFTAFLTPLTDLDRLLKGLGSDIDIFTQLEQNIADAGLGELGEKIILGLQLREFGPLLIEQIAESIENSGNVEVVRQALIRAFDIKNAVTNPVNEATAAGAEAVKGITDATQLFNKEAEKITQRDIKDRGFFGAFSGITDIIENAVKSTGAFENNIKDAAAATRNLTALFKQLPPAIQALIAGDEGVEGFQFTVEKAVETLDDFNRRSAELEFASTLESIAKQTAQLEKINQDVLKTYLDQSNSIERIEELTREVTRSKRREIQAQIDANNAIILQKQNQIETNNESGLAADIRQGEVDVLNATNDSLRAKLDLLDEELEVTKAIVKAQNEQINIARQLSRAQRQFIDAFKDLTDTDIVFENLLEELKITDNILNIRREINKVVADQAQPAAQLKPLNQEIIARFDEAGLLDRQEELLETLKKAGDPSVPFPFNVNAAKAAQDDLDIIRGKMREIGGSDLIERDFLVEQVNRFQLTRDILEQTILLNRIRLTLQTKENEEVKIKNALELRNKDIQIQTIEALQERNNSLSESVFLAKALEKIKFDKATLEFAEQQRILNENLLSLQLYLKEQKKLEKEIKDTNKVLDTGRISLEEDIELNIQKLALIFQQQQAIRETLELEQARERDAARGFGFIYEVDEKTNELLTDMKDGVITTFGRGFKQVGKDFNTFFSREMNAYLREMDGTLEGMAKGMVSILDTGAEALARRIVDSGDKIGDILRAAGREIVVGLVKNQLVKAGQFILEKLPFGLGKLFETKEDVQARELKLAFDRLTTAILANTVALGQSELGKDIEFDDTSLIALIKQLSSTSIPQGPERELLENMVREIIKSREPEERVKTPTIFPDPSEALKAGPPSDLKDESKSLIDQIRLMSDENKTQKDVLIESRTHLSNIGLALTQNKSPIVDHLRAIRESLEKRKEDIEKAGPTPVSVPEVSIASPEQHTVTVPLEPYTPSPVEEREREHIMPIDTGPITAAANAIEDTTTIGIEAIKKEAEAVGPLYMDTLRGISTVTDGTADKLETAGTVAIDSQRKVVETSISNSEKLAEGSQRTVESVAEAGKTTLDTVGEGILAQQEVLANQGKDLVQSGKDAINVVADAARGTLETVCQKILDSSPRQQEQEPVSSPMASLDTGELETKVAGVTRELESQRTWPERFGLAVGEAFNNVVDFVFPPAMGADITEVPVPAPPNVTVQAAEAAAPIVTAPELPEVADTAERKTEEVIIRPLEKENILSDKLEIKLTTLNETVTQLFNAYIAVSESVLLRLEEFRLNLWPLTNQRLLTIAQNTAECCSADMVRDNQDTGKILNSELLSDTTNAIKKGNSQLTEGLSQVSSITEQSIDGDKKGIDLLQDTSERETDKINTEQRIHRLLTGKLENSARGLLQKSVEGNTISSNILDAILSAGVQETASAFAQFIGPLISSFSGGNPAGGSTSSTGFVGPPTSLANLPETASGGVFSGAQTRVIGEAGPEAVVPLPNNREIPVQFLDNQEKEPSINITQNFDFRKADAGVVAQLRQESQRIQERSVNEVFSRINRGGQAAKIAGRR